MEQKLGYSVMLHFIEIMEEQDKNNLQLVLVFGGGGGRGANSVGGPGLKSTSVLNTTLGAKGRDGIYMGSYFWTNVGENGYFAGGGGGGQY